MAQPSSAPLDVGSVITNLRDAIAALQRDALDVKYQQANLAAHLMIGAINMLEPHLPKPRDLWLEKARVLVQRVRETGRASDALALFDHIEAERARGLI